MKVKDLKKKSAQDLNKHAAKLRSELAEMKRDKYLVDEKNVNKARNIRKELARTLTFINQQSESEEQVETKAEDKENK